MLNFEGNTKIYENLKNTNPKTKKVFGGWFFFRILGIFDSELFDVCSEFIILNWIDPIVFFTTKIRRAKEKKNGENETIINYPHFI